MEGAKTSTLAMPVSMGFPKYLCKGGIAPCLIPFLKRFAHDEVITLSQFLDKLIQAAKIITIIGVTHDDIFPAGRRNAAHQRIPDIL